MPTQMDLRQSVLRSALPMVGSAANATADSLFPLIDAELAKHFEDRNILLTDGGTLTFTGTQLQLTENLNLTLNQKISGAVPQVISLGSSNQNFTSSGDMLVATINRTAGTATVSIVTSGSALPAAASANQEVFLIAKRVDAGDGTQRLYFRNGMAMNAGQSVRLGAAGSGSGGSGTGDDLDALQFRASFTDTFQENAANANSSINSSGTNGTFNAAKNMYAISYDASKTVTGTSVNMTLSGAPAFTVVAGDVLIVGTDVRKIVTVTSQTVYVLESALTSNPTAAAATVSQAVYTKDIYNIAVDGAALSAAFGASTFSEILVDYKDNASAGSNLFTPNVVPVVGFIASPDNTTFTTLQVRATNETDTAGSTILSSAGTGLFIRFFANKSSGSGTVNLLTYKSFMQKSVASAAGGILNAAYAFTNGIGTPVNCSVGISGGKTTLTLTFQYAVGVNATTNSPYGSVDVYLNGQMVPRFINATLTPDASYTEVSSTIIKLDRDYSSQNISVEVLQRTQIVDASTTNTSLITALQAASNVGSQGFVDNGSNIRAATTATGTPSVGTFYSSITGRASITDISQDLKASMGIERIMVQQIVEIQNEFGPNGEKVFGALNDDRGLIRFVGGWSVANDPSGIRPQTSGTANADYVEITFYGTGLNLLDATDSNNRAFTYTVDGGGTNAGSYPATGSAVITGRNYAANTVLSVVSGLTLGVHTVRVTASGTVNKTIYGFEVINSSSAINANPGTGYIAGQKLSTLLAQSVSYNSTFDSGALGTRGGHVVVYQKSDGTIGKAVTPTNATQANLTSADHTNEEILKTHSFREFGAGRSDDFSLALGSNRAFALDDGTTALTATGIQAATINGFDVLQVVNDGTSFFALTFVGTGLDVLVTFANTNTTTGWNISIDGTSIGTLTLPTSTATTRNLKIVSGLPYGTHTCKITTNSTGSGNYGLLAFKTYQPKKPTLPSGAIELADYNVMATYVPVTGTYLLPSVGTLVKSPVREMTFSGTWSASIASISGLQMQGWLVSSTTVGDYIEYNFFGTGIEVSGTGNPTSASATIQIDGAAYTGAASAQNTGSWTPGTSTWALGVGSLLQISTLALGMHKIRVTLSAVNTQFQFFYMAVITPIHSAKANIYADLQNTLSVGSCAISDNRKFTPSKDALPSTKAWAQAIGITSGPTSSSTTFVPVPDMSCTIKTTGGPLDISYCNSVQLSASVNNLYCQIFVDGLPVGTEKSPTLTASGYTALISDRMMVPVSAGVHKVDVYWKISTGTGTAFQLERTLLVREN